MTAKTLLDGAGASFSYDLNLSLGRQAAALVRSVALCTEDNTLLTSISGQLPATLGTKTAANSLPVTLASDGALTTVSGTTTDAAVANGAGGTIAGYLRSIKDATTSTASSPVTIDQTTPGTTNGVVSTPASTAYALIPAPSTYRLLSALATTNGANIKASAGAIKGIQGSNTKTSPVYIKFYNKATAPTVGTDTPVKTLYIPASTTFSIPFPSGVSFSTGIGIAITGAAADADTTALVAGDVVCLNVDYH